MGTDHATAAFAVEPIRRWWNPELARFAAEAQLAITVCHLPPATSKWNRIEHRLVSHNTMNWRGRPLTSHEVIVESIAATTTKTGLTVHAELDTNPYPTGIQVSDDEIDALPSPRTASTATGTTPSTPSVRWTRR